MHLPCLSPAKRAFATLSLLFTINQVQAITINQAWINEIHYDNAGGDVDEFVEIAGIAGTNLSDLKLEFYNGSNGTEYHTETLAGILSDSGNGYGFLKLEIPDIQNGAPDGLALIFDSTSVLQFLSYEGSFTATDKTADGLISTDISVFQSSSTPVGSSLQFLGVAGTGSWTGPVTATAGEINTGQILPALTTNNNSNAVPGTESTLGLLGLSLFAVFAVKRRKP